jgi:hypothetical protein
MWQIRVRMVQCSFHCILNFTLYSRCCWNDSILVSPYKICQRAGSLANRPGADLRRTSARTSSVAYPEAVPVFLEYDLSVSSNSSSPGTPADSSVVVRRLHAGP